MYEFTSKDIEGSYREISRYLYVQMCIMYISYIHMRDRKNKANLALRKSETF